jgi:predicted metal-dependent phosphoesterase TrpH
MPEGAREIIRSPARFVNRDSARIEMHCHTVASHDGMITFNGLKNICRERRVDVVCITDHDTVEGAVEFQRRARAENLPLEIIVGEERTLENKCHLIGLFLREPIQSASVAGAIAEIHAQGGLALVPHPFRGKDGLLGPRGLLDANTIGADAFEIHTAKSSLADNMRSREELANGKSGVFGGSDAHYEADVAQCVNVAPWQGSAEATIRAMLARKTPFTILARPQSAGTGERKYAPAYYAMKRFARVPRFMLPAAKKLYRFYWNRAARNRDFSLVPVYEHRPG